MATRKAFLRRRLRHIRRANIMRGATCPQCSIPIADDPTRSGRLRTYCTRICKDRARNARYSLEAACHN
jgi:hypothetical protein